MRNSGIHGVSLPMGSALEWCGSIYNDYKRSLEVASTDTRGGGDFAGRVDKWKPSYCGTIKINVDVGFLVESRVIGGVGVVARDYSGRVLDAVTNYVPHGFSTMTVELLAIKEGQVLAKKRGWDNVVLESE